MPKPVISTLAALLMSGQYGEFRVNADDYDGFDWETIVAAEPVTSADWDKAPAVVVPCTEWSDYSDAVYRSNHRAMLADLGSVVQERGYASSYSSACLVVPVWIDAEGFESDAECESPLVDVDAARELAGQFVALRDEYALWDESDHSALEHELVDESWDAWLGWDVRSVIGDLSPEWTDEVLREAFFDAYWLMSERDNLYPEVESATTVFLPEWESVARELAAGIASGAVRPSVESA